MNLDEIFLWPEFCNLKCKFQSEKGATAMMERGMSDPHPIRILSRWTVRLLPVIGCLLALSASAGATPILLALDPRNVADDGVASVFETSGGGLVTAVANANDTEFTGDIANNLLTITGDVLGIQIDLAAATDLTEVAAYVDPAAAGTDPFKNTNAVEFLISTNSGVSYGSLGFGAFTPGALDSFSYVNIVGSFSGVTNIRYRFFQADQGGEGQRIPEVLAFSRVPEPSTLLLMGLALTGFAFGVRRKTPRS